MVIIYRVRVVIVKVGQDVPEVKLVENKLENFQEIVGGKLEFAERSSDFFTYKHEDDFIADLPYNRNGIYGDFFVVKLKDPDWGEEFINMTEEEAKRFVNIYTIKRRK